MVSCTSRRIPIENSSTSGVLDTAVSCLGRDRHAQPTY